MTYVAAGVVVALLCVPGVLAQGGGPVGEGTVRFCNALDVCRTLTAAPPALRAGQASIVHLRARNLRGQPLPRLVVRARGLGLSLAARTDRRGVARLAIPPSRIGLIHFVAGRAGVAGCLLRLGVVRGSETSLTG